MPNEDLEIHYEIFIVHLRRSVSQLQEILHTVYPRKYVQGLLWFVCFWLYHPLIGVGISHIEDETKYSPFCRWRFKFISSNKNRIFIPISWCFVPESQFANQSVLVQIMAWRRTAIPLLCNWVTPASRLCLSCNWVTPAERFIVKYHHAICSRYKTIHSCST